MYFHNENQTLYPASIEYNLTLIMNEVARIAENNGAIVDYKAYNHGFIVNRSIMELIDEKKARIEHLTGLIKEGKSCSLFDDPEKNKKAIAAMRRAVKDYEHEIEKLELINNDPIEIKVGSYVIFALNGVYYHYSLPDLVFDPARIYKTPIINGCYDRHCYGIEDNKESWFYDCFWRADCSKADIKEAANLIYNLMLNAPMSKPYHETTRRRVANTYNGGYHYEVIVKPTKLEKVDFLTEDK